MPKSKLNIEKEKLVLDAVEKAGLRAREKVGVIDNRALLKKAWKVFETVVTKIPTSSESSESSEEEAPKI